MVYRAEHVQLGRPAALKMLLPQLSSNPVIVQRFFNEARAASAIDHPGIVEVYDFGTHSDGAAYIVMALLKGESLEARLRRGVLPPFEAAGILAQVLGALAAAHGRGIVHRDLKPDNIFIVPNELMPGGIQVKLLDFGIAKLTGDTTSGMQTQTGVMMGTPAYMSPEQCMGKSDLDHRTDLYSIGCILYHLLTGRPPFTGEHGTGMLIAAHIRDTPDDPRTINPNLPGNLVTIVMKLLEKEPAARFQTALETRDALAAIGVSPVSRPPASPDAPLGFAQTMAPVSAYPSSPSSPSGYPHGAPGFAGTPVALGALTNPTTSSGSAAQVYAGSAATVTPAKSRAGVFAVVGLLLAALGGVGIWAALRGTSRSSPQSIASTAAAKESPPTGPTGATGPNGAITDAAKGSSAPAGTTGTSTPTTPPQSPPGGGLDPSRKASNVAGVTGTASAPVPQGAKPPSPPHPDHRPDDRAHDDRRPVPPPPPQPSGPAPTLRLGAKAYAPGASIDIKFASPMTSPSNNRAWVTIVAAGSNPEHYGTWEYVDDRATATSLPGPATAGAYEVRLHTDFPQRTTNLRQSVPFVVKDKGAGAIAQASGDHRFMLASKIARVGSDLEITYPAPMKAAPKEQFWITVVEKGASDTVWGTYEYVKDGATTTTLAMPAKAGNYEIRLHANYPRLTTNVVHRVSIRVED